MCLLERVKNTAHLILQNPTQIVDFRSTSLIKLVIFFIFLFGTGEIFSQQIPRAGFPYCQPFLGTQDVNSIPFTVADGEGAFNGNPFIPYQTGQGLRLTESGVNLRGWIFVDLPFSPTYGIKTSFEYFIHNQGTSSGLGDGFSFFLFDGKIDKTNFEIGGLGGSLGYAPHGSNVSGTYTSGGLKGGYMGIGFDVLGNYGNFQEKKYGGFHDPNQFYYTSTAAFRRAYPDAITIRSPQDPLDLSRDNGAPLANTLTPPFKSYQFVTGKILYYDPTYVYPLPVSYMNFRVNTVGSGDIYSNPVEKSKYILDDANMFRLSEGLAPSNFSCVSRPIGYRKVFIDLKPNVGNPLIPYTITIDLLVDNEPTTRRIIDNQPYAYPIPAGTEFLKLGFSASTGTDFYSAIDIRNVAALVSSVDDLKKPTPPELFKEICVEDNTEVELPFCVTLADQNTFIQCIQLFDDFSPADNDFQDDFYQCEQPGFCNQRCVEGRKELQILDGSGGLIGTLKADLSELVEVGKYNQANITFERNPASTWVGTIKKYYKIVDNFGLESDAIPITITINPKPKLISFGVPLDPTCSGQNDGSLTGIQIGDLVPDPGKYTIEFYDENGAVLNAVLVNEQVGTNGLITATFNLNGLNLGKIFVKATNPSSTSLGPICGNNSNEVADPCILEDELVYDFNQERGTPVIVVDPVSKICEGTPVSYTPDVDQVYKNNVSAPPVFLWYTDKDRLNKINPAVNSIVVNGTTVSTGDIVINSSGVLSFQSLPAGQYEFFVEVDDTNFPTGGNFCINSGVLTKVELSVIPAITIQATSTPDWCLDNSGTITITTQGGSGTKTVKLFKNGSSSPTETKVGSGSTFTFSGLIAGDYEVEVTTQDPACSQILSPIKVDGPSSLLVLTPGPSVNAFCNSSNGSLQFNISGGNTGYSIKLNGSPFTGATVSGNTYTISNLPAGSHLIEVTDSKNCTKSISLTINGDPLPSFNTTNDEICVGEDAVIQPVIGNQSTSTPTFSWFASDGSGGYLPITNSSTFNGAKFSINPTTSALTVSGLPASSTPYVYYLQITGPKVCSNAYLPAEIKVNGAPPLAAPLLKMVECFGQATGSIQAAVTSGNLSDFQYSLTGSNGVNISFTSNGGLFQNLAAGIYTLTARNSSGCITSISNIEITQPAELKIESKEVIDASCGENNGSWTVAVTGGTLKSGETYQVTFDSQPVSGLGANFVTNGPGNYTVKSVAPGTHTLVIKDSNNCSVTINQQFVALPIPRFDTQDLIICEGQTGVLIPQIVDQAGSMPSFSWSFEDPLKPGSFITINSGDKVGSVTYTISNGQLIVEGLAPQTAPYIYYLSVSGNLVCPANPIPAEIKVVKNPEATFEIEKVSCFGGSDGVIRLISSNPSSDLTFTLVGKGQSNSTGIFTGLPAGSYIVAVKNLSGCEISVPLEIPQPAAPIQINKPDVLRSSCDLENGSIENLVISGGWGNYTVTWKKGSLTGTTITGSATEVKNLGPGTYYLIIKDDEGCEVSFSFVIEESSDPEYAIVPPINACLGQPVSIRPVHLAPNPSLPPASPTEVQWYTGPGKTGLISNGADPSTPSITYAINDTDWLNPELEVTGLPAGVHDFYFYVVCTGKESKIEVTVYDVPEVELELTPITCFGNTNGKVKITSGSLPVYTYTVNGGAPLSQSAFEALNLGAGVYNLEVNTPAGCAQKTTFEILGPSAALSSTVMTKVDPGCNAPNGKLEFTLTGGWLPYTLEVIKNGTSLGTQTTSNSAVVLNGYTSGEYQVKVTDARGCTITTNTVTLVDGPSQIAVQDAEICVGGTAVLTPTIDPLAPGAVFNWFLDAGLTQKINSSATPAGDGRIYLIDGTGSLSVSNLPARVAPYVYYVTATGPGVCTGFVERVEVKVYDLPTVSSVIKNEVCFGDGGEITVQASGGSGNYSYSLNGGPFGAGNVFKVPVGTYQVEVRTKEGCSLILNGLSVTGPVSALEANNLQQDSPTCGQSNGAVRFQISGGYPPYTVTWIKNGTNSGSQNIAAPGQAVISNLGVGNYSFQVRDNSGCLVSLPTNFTLVEVPTVISISDDVICEGELAELIPTLPQNIINPAYSWSLDAEGNSIITDGMTINGATFDITPTGNMSISGLKGASIPYKYYVTASGNGICNISPKEVKVQVYSFPTLRVSNPSVVCDPKGTVDLTDYIEGFNPSVYDYNVLSPSGVSMQISELEKVSLSGDYRVSSSIKGSGCWNQPLRIRVLIADELLEAAFNYEVDLGNGILLPNAEVQIQEIVQFSDFSLGKAIIWNWNFGDGTTSTAQNPTHQYQNKGTYTVSLQVIDSLGCISTYERVIVVTDDYRIMVPNAFTPDGLKNQSFKPYTRGIASMEFYIFNTWGELLYKSESLEDLGWNGMHNGKPAQNGNYVYRGKFTSRSGEVSERSGVFILIR